MMNSQSSNSKEKKKKRKEKRGINKCQVGKYYSRGSAGILESLINQ